VSFLKLKNLKKVTRTSEIILEFCNLIHTEKDVFVNAWETLSAQKLRLSFTDCITIAAMHSQKIQKVATYDSDFAKVEEITVL
jgi:predicted nucleic acid-binding protein